MLEKRNCYKNTLYSGGTGGGSFNWKQPAQVLHWLVYLVRNPAGAIKQVAAEENITQPLVLAVINVVSVFFASIICVVVMNMRYSFYLSWVHMPSAGIIIFAVLLALVFDFGFPGLLFVSTNIIFKEKAEFSKMLSITGGKVIIDSLFILTGSVFMLFSHFFFFLFATTGNIFSFTVLITVYNEEIKIPAVKKIYSFSVSLAITYIIMMVILKAVTPLFMGNILNYISLF